MDEINVNESEQDVEMTPTVESSNQHESETWEEEESNDYFSSENASIEIVSSPIPFSIHSESSDENLSVVNNPRTNSSPCQHASISTGNIENVHTDDSTSQSDVDVTSLDTPSTIDHISIAMANTPTVNSRTYDKLQSFLGYFRRRNENVFPIPSESSCSCDPASPDQEIDSPDIVVSQPDLTSNASTSQSDVDENDSDTPSTISYFSIEMANTPTISDTDVNNPRSNSSLSHVSISTGNIETHDDIENVHTDTDDSTSQSDMAVISLDTPSTISHSSIAMANISTSNTVVTHDQPNSNSRDLNGDDTGEPPAKCAKIDSDQTSNEVNTCLICFEPWTNSGEHRLASLSCGHLFGGSCINRWLTPRPNRYCPFCKAQASLQDIRYIYATSVSCIDNSECEALRAELEIAKLENVRKAGEIQKLRFNQELNLDKIKIYRKSCQFLNHDANHR
ncbi:uncharacterized protein LOC143909418 [Arctopsyche grandis]|uniref:uncharacterized protein LOC143909418 n=1 Tax=Arctopsyche grandis TaxID=121162 RepID=UPI00406D697D